MSFTPHKTIRHSRKLRREQTAAELQLWNRLRDRRLNGHKFVHQESIGPFIADFVCREKRLVVEVDGATHGETHEIAYDERRTRYLNAQGFRVLRVQNDDVYKILPDVLDTIVFAMEGAAERD
jgi:very-short-patch-repair endonuclease